MTAPRASGSVTLVTGRHGRTNMGLALMSIAVVYALAVHVFGGLLHLTPTACATAWVQIVNEWGFPGLLFVAGFRLFDLDAFKDTVAAAKSLLPGQSPPAA